MTQWNDFEHSDLCDCAVCLTRRRVSAGLPNTFGLLDIIYGVTPNTVLLTNIESPDHPAQSEYRRQHQRWGAEPDWSKSKR